MLLENNINYFKLVGRYQTFPLVHLMWPTPPKYTESTTVPSQDERHRGNVHLSKVYEVYA